MAKLISIILIILASTVSAQKIFDSKGHPFARRQGKSQEPKEIVDTVRMAAGNATLVLQKAFKSKQHSTVPTSSTNISVSVTQVIDSLTQPIYTYGWKISNDTLFIVSSNSGDVSKVNVRAIIK